MEEVGIVMKANTYLTKAVEQFYLEYFNSSRELVYIAERHLLPIEVAETLIEYGRKINHGELIEL